MRTFIIAEIGSNHNGDIDRARWLIREAKHAKASAAKFQLWLAEDITPPENWPAARQFELPPEWVPCLYDECLKCEVEFMCTPFSVQAVEILNPYVKRWKIASYDVGKTDMVKAVVSTGKPIIVSDGRSPWTAIRRLLPSAKVLHCVSQYPAPVSGLLSCAFRYEVDGLSDHTLSTVLPAAAVAMGATIIEKHLTLQRPDSGPDHAHSLTPGEFSQMVYNISEVELAVYGQPVPTPPRPDRLEWVLDDSVTAGRG
jgi:N-acetylneuraminate synthase